MKRKPCARTILALAVLSAIQPADAQQQVEKAERIEVTGSRIASSGLEGASPVAVVKAEEIRMDGFQSLELILNGFPQLVGEQGNRISNGATGTATVDLRGLGSFRTLVLLNGRRLPPGSPGALSTDLNQVPISLISRVDILTGGASAVYGSDAIAGVVNIVLNDRFEGVQGELAYDFYNHNQKSAIADVVRARNFDLPGDKSRDGASTGANLTLGGNFANDKGNATFSLRYLKAEPLLQSERDYSACSLAADARGFFCGGSPTSYPGLFQDHGSQWTVADSLGRVRPWLPATDLYNFAPLNYYQRPGERYGFNAFANYDLSADAKVYAEFGFHDDHTVAQIAPSGIFGELVTVRYDNPLLSTDWRDRLIFLNPDGTEGTGPGTSALVAILRRNVEGGGRQDDLRHTSFRQVIGLKGAFARNWDYDVFMQTAKVVYQETYRHDFSISRATRALDVVAHPATGAAVCASALDGSDPSCVPYNIWTLGGVTPAALAYLETPGIQRGFTSQQVMGATVSADLGHYGVRLPRSSSGVGVAFGIERRTEKMEFQTDVAFSSGDLAGQGHATPGMAGGFTVNEIFGEARVPILDGLNISGSYRHSDYSTGKATNTFGIGFNAAPVTFARIRGSYQRAVRAANLNELFFPQAGSSYVLLEGDPCAGAAPVRSLADCQRTGVTAAQYGRIVHNPNRFVYPGLFGGNGDLEPETAQTVTLGVVLTPTKGLSATVDYFDIRLEETIGGVDPAVMLQQCLTAGTPVFCRAITRDPVFGTLWIAPAQVVGTLQNVGRMRVSGADISVAYTRELHGGNVVAIAATGTYLSRWSFEAYPGAGPTECDGLHGGGVCGRPRPTWRHRLRATWQTPWNVDLGMTWRYIHSVTKAGNPQPIDRELKAMNYLDISASWSIHRRLTLRGGINNVTDRDPPLTAGINGNTWTQTYDVLGRHIFMSLTAKF